MRLTPVRAVLWRDGLQMVRTPRAFVNVLLVPAYVVVVVLGVPHVVDSLRAGGPPRVTVGIEAHEDDRRVALLRAALATSAAAAIDSRLVPDAADAVRRDAVQVGVRLSPGSAQLFFVSTSEPSQIGAAIVGLAIPAADARAVIDTVPAAVLAEHGAPTAVSSLEGADLARPDHRGRRAAGAAAPIALTVAVGGLTTLAASLLIGDKADRQYEAILLVPGAGRALALGRFTLAVGLALASASTSLAVLVISGWLHLGDLSFTGSAVLAFAVAALALALASAALNTWLGFRSRTGEDSAWLGAPVMLLSTFTGAAVGLTSFALPSLLHAVPFVGPVFLARDAAMGTATPSTWLLSTGGAALFTALTLRAALRQSATRRDRDVLRDARLAT